LRYEDLVADPRGECRKLCRFLDIPFDEDMLRVYESRAKDGQAGDEKHAWQPITSGLREWRSQMSPQDVELFEAAAGSLLDELGYSRANAAPRPEALQYASEARERCAQDAQSHRYAVPECWGTEKGDCPFEDRGTVPFFRAG
jgi:hypothetical protein